VQGNRDPTGSQVNEFNTFNTFNVARADVESCELHKLMNVNQLEKLNSTRHESVESGSFAQEQAGEELAAGESS
jgi:hypothetical protein